MRLLPAAEIGKQQTISIFIGFVLSIVQKSSQIPDVEMFTAHRNRKNGVYHLEKVKGHTKIPQDLESSISKYESDFTRFHGHYAI